MGARQDRACAAICLSERTVQRWQRDAARGDQRPERLQAPKNKLSVLEREHLVAVANSDEFGHLPPGQIVPRLADRGQYIGSESTFNRVLKAHNLLRHRGAERPPHKRIKPRALCAAAPDELFSWDITYLPTLTRGLYFYLYLFMDIFSRKIVGWQIYETESSELAAEVMRDICERENIAPGQVVLHSDNGSPMKGATMLATLQALGVMPSFSRPAVSNDNPYSESLFKTMKYRPIYPRRAFESLQVARLWVSQFVQWYNHEHAQHRPRRLAPQPLRRKTKYRRRQRRQRSDRCRRQREGGQVRLRVHHLDLLQLVQPPEADFRAEENFGEWFATIEMSRRVCLPVSWLEHLPTVQC